MRQNCEICSKSGTLGRDVMKKRVEGNAIFICRVCEDSLYNRPKVTTIATAVKKMMKNKKT